jgi:ubiquitin-conjugating enzyme E2 I
MSGGAGVAKARLAQERKNWRKDHPFGFVARPQTNEDGSNDFMNWKCSFPGKKGSDWEGGTYPVTLTFTDSYPSKAPLCRLPPGFFHPNLYPSGKVCLSIVNDETGWRPSITIKQILVGIQDLLENPNIDDPAQEEAYHCYIRDRAKYRQRVRQQAQQYHDPNLS